MGKNFVFPNCRNKQEKYSLTHCLLALFAKNAFCGHFEVFRLEIGQISFNRVKKAFATWQLASLSTSNAFYDILARAWAEIKILISAQNVQCKKDCQLINVDVDVDVERGKIFG